MVSRFLLALAIFTVATPASADDRDKYPVQYSMSPLGTNLQTGMFLHTSEELKIGDLSFVREWGDQSNLFRPGMKLFGDTLVGNRINYGWTHNLNQGTRAVAAGGSNTHIQVIVEQNLYLFELLSNGSVSPKGHSGAGTYLYRSGDAFRFTDRSGAQYEFEISSTIGQEGYNWYPNQRLTRTIRPDGTILTYSYRTDGKLQEMRSTRGYAIHLDYDSNANISAACGVNLASTYWTPTTSCSGATLKTAYGYNGGGTQLTSATNVMKGVVQFQYVTAGAFAQPSCITRVDSLACAVANTYGNPTPSECNSNRPNQVATQTNAEGKVWKYCFEPTPSTIDEPYREGWPRWAFATMTEPDGLGHFLTYDRGRLVDDQGRAGNLNYKYPGGTIKASGTTMTITFDYYDTRPGMVTNPEGNADFYVYNSRGGVLQVIRAPKGAPDPTIAGIGAALPTDPDLRRCCLKIGVIEPPAGSITIGQGYLSNTVTGCSGPTDARVCDKPIARIDERGNQTDFVYDATHGGLLTETAPAAAPGGIRPQTRYTYVQRTAWVKNSSGTYVAGDPIWLMATKSFCRTTAPDSSGVGCATTDDEVVTSYEYGPNSGPNNLLLRGLAVTADGVTLRTCYGYDWQGNRISETKPKAGLTSCP